MSENLHKRRCRCSVRAQGVVSDLINRFNALEEGQRVMETVLNPKATYRVLNRKRMGRRLG